MSIDNLHNEHFNTRLTKSDAYSASLMALLQEKGHFESYRKSSRDEDLGGIDWWIVYPSQTEEIPIQFKMRDKKKDVPVVRYQPFKGIDNDKTVEGRDWRGLQGKVAQEYYVAIRDDQGRFAQVYRVSCNKLRKLAQDLDDKWNAAEKTMSTFGPSFFDSKRVGVWLENGIWNRCVFQAEDGSQVWWKKNRNEGSPKFNMYIPYNCSEWNYLLSKDDAAWIENAAGVILSEAKG